MGVEPIGKTIEAVLKGLSQGRGGQQEAVGSAIMSLLDGQEKQHARPGRLSKAVLTLYIDSPTRMYALNLKKARLLEKLRSEFGQDAVCDIRLRIGKVG